MTSTTPQGHRPAETSRIELRATEDDRDLLDRAAAALGTDRSSFLLAQGRLAAQRVLADRQHFSLDTDAEQEWERINSSPARRLPGLALLLERPSPFVTQAADQPRHEPHQPAAAAGGPSTARRLPLRGADLRLVEIAQQAQGPTRVLVVTESDQQAV